MKNFVYSLFGFLFFAAREAIRYYMREFGFGGTVFLFMTSMLAALVFCSCTDTTLNPQQNKTADAESGETMGRVIFVNYASFTLPSAPGAVNTAPTFYFLPYFGTKTPKIGDPSDNENTVWGCDPQSAVTLNRVRSYVLGAKGLRHGIPASGTIQNYALITFNRVIQGFTGSYYGVPLSLNEEWQDVDIVFNGLSGPGAMQPALSQILATFDTRNLDSSYYGTGVKLGIELDCSCVLKGF